MKFKEGDGEFNLGRHTTGINGIEILQEFIEIIDGKRRHYYCCRIGSKQHGKRENRSRGKNNVYNNLICNNLTDISTENCKRPTKQLNIFFSHLRICKLFVWLCLDFK